MSEGVSELVSVCTVFSQLTGDIDIDDVIEDLNHPLFLSFTPGVVEVAANKNSRTEFTTTHNNYSTSKYTLLFDNK